MRQGGMTPKSHNSGIYWVRANANTGSGQSKERQPTYEIVPYLVAALPFALIGLAFYGLYRLLKKVIKSRS
jgi:hypothetical protein